MKIAICDDEKEYRQLLSNYVTSYFTEKCIEYECFEFESGEDLLSSERKYDIAFLDIEMGEMDGIQTAKKINEKCRNTLIFIITAYQKYLDDAMDLSIFRYIDKPVNANRIYNGLDKAIEFINNNDISFRTTGGGVVKVLKSDIICAEVVGRKVLITTVNQKYSTRESMTYFKDRLNASYFAIPHNSYIVNFNFIKGYKRNYITLCNGESISIAPKKQTAIRKKFLQFVGEEYEEILK